MQKKIHGQKRVHENTATFPVKAVSHVSCCWCEHDFRAALHESVGAIRTGVSGVRNSKPRAGNPKRRCL